MIVLNKPKISPLTTTSWLSKLMMNISLLIRDLINHLIRVLYIWLYCTRSSCGLRVTYIRQSILIQFYGLNHSKVHLRAALYFCLHLHYGMISATTNLFSKNSTILIFYFSQHTRYKFQQPIFRKYLNKQDTNIISMQVVIKHGLLPKLHVWHLLYT